MQKFACHLASTPLHSYCGFKTKQRRPLKCSALVCAVKKWKVQRVDTADSCRGDCSKIHRPVRSCEDIWSCVCARSVDERESCRSGFCVLSVDKIPCQKRILSLQLLCSFCGQDSMPKENFVAPVSVFFLWTRFHAKRESCRSSFCVLSVDKIACQKRILSLQFLCSFCGQDCMPKENLVAPVSVFFLWTRFHARKGILSL